MKKKLFLAIFLFPFLMANAQTDEPNSSAGITLELPFINNASFYSYNLNGSGKNESKTGYLGSGVAIFFKNNRNKFSIGFENPSLSKSFFAPKGGSPNLTVNIFEATLHHKILSQVALIGGVNYATYRFRLYTDIPQFPSVDKRDKTIGLTTGIEFVPANSFSFVVTYRPAIFSFDKKAYQAIFSLGLRYDINFWKQKSQ